MSARTSWTELRGSHFVLQGAIDVERLRPIACEVEEALSALDLRPATGSIPSVIAATSEREMREVLPQYWERRGPRPLGGYWSGPYGHHIAVRIDVRREERLRRLLHELAHFATHRTQPSPPPWLDEGLSELWEHAAIDAERIEIGGPVTKHLKLLRSNKSWIPMTDLLSATTLPDGGRGSKASMFYAQSWALVHYLQLGKGSGKVLLDRLPDRDALPADDELQRYVRGSLSVPLRIARVVPAATCGDLQARSLPHTESLIVKARALADGERPDSALPLLREVLLREPANPGAVETMGFVHFAGNRFQESAALFDRIIAEKAGSHIAYYYRALLAGPIPGRVDGSGPVPALDYLREAIRLNPEFRPARDRLRELLGKHRLRLWWDLCQSKLD